MHKKKSVLYPPVLLMSPERVMLPGIVITLLTATEKLKESVER